MVCNRKPVTPRLETCGTKISRLRDSMYVNIHVCILYRYMKVLCILYRYMKVFLPNRFAIWFLQLIVRNNVFTMVSKEMSDFNRCDFPLSDIFDSRSPPTWFGHALVSEHHLSTNWTRGEELDSDDMLPICFQPCRRHGPCDSKLVTPQKKIVFFFSLFNLSILSLLFWVVSLQYCDVFKKIEWDASKVGSENWRQWYQSRRSGKIGRVLNCGTSLRQFDIFCLIHKFLWCSLEIKIFNIETSPCKKKNSFV